MLKDLAKSNSDSRPTDASVDGYDAQKDVDVLLDPISQFALEIANGSGEREALAAVSGACCVLIGKTFGDDIA